MTKHPPHTFSRLSILLLGMIAVGCSMDHKDDTDETASGSHSASHDASATAATSAAMGVIGIFSYLGAALQENVSGALLEQHSHMVGADRVYDFGPAIWFWIGSSVVSMVLAATLWRAKLRD